MKLREKFRKEFPNIQGHDEWIELTLNQKEQLEEADGLLKNIFYNHHNWYEQLKKYMRNKFNIK